MTSFLPHTLSRADSHERALAVARSHARACPHWAVYVWEDVTKTRSSCITATEAA
jgi:hypothetical protein